MSVKDNETIADIIAHKRQQAAYIAQTAQGKRNACRDKAEDEARDIRREADRLEAALRRERGDRAKLRDALEDARNFLLKHCCGCSEAQSIVSRIDCALAAPARNCDVGRDTLSAALEQVNKVYDILSRPCVVIEEARQGCREARGVLIPALAEPVKNCEVGNAKEQLARFIAFCKGQRLHSSGHADTCNPKCPCRDGGDVNLCALTWAQMPYEEGEKKGDAK